MVLHQMRNEMPKSAILPYPFASYTSGETSDQITETVQRIATLLIPGYYRVVKLRGGSSQCLDCGKILSSYGVARRHYKTSHLTSTIRSTCQICQKEFKNHDNLNDHLRKNHKVYQKS
jgi:uncharacterized Zn-finger protein